MAPHSSILITRGSSQAKDRTQVSCISFGKFSAIITSNLRLPHILPLQVLKDPNITDTLIHFSYIYF